MALGAKESGNQTWCAYTEACPCTRANQNASAHAWCQPTLEGIMNAKCKYYSLAVHLFSSRTRSMLQVLSNKEFGAPHQGSPVWLRALQGRHAQPSNVSPTTPTS